MTVKPIFNVFVVSGAYGRDYQSEAEALNDWAMGKDFYIRSLNARGSYISNQEIYLLVESGYDTLRIRYNHLQDAVEIRITE